MQVWSLGWEDPPEEEMTTHSNIFAWEIPCTEESGSLQSMGSQRVRQDLVAKPLYELFLSNKIQSENEMKL